MVRGEHVKLAQQTGRQLRTGRYERESGARLAALLEPVFGLRLIKGVVRWLDQ